MPYYAHSIEGKEEKNWHLLKEHLESTAKIASCFSEKFLSSELGYILGIFHDIGKYSEQFQKRLKGECFHVDHSTAGVQEILNLYGNVGKLLAYCIAGHHAGMPDGSNYGKDNSLEDRKKRQVYDYSAYKEEIDISKCGKITGLPIKPVGEYKGFTLAFFIRMLFSCLVDADFLDTESAVNEMRIFRGQYPRLIQLNQSFNKYMNQFSNRQDKINIKRAEIREQCIITAKSKPGLFTLTVPTGGGKTLSSMAFALRHSIQNEFDRIIYVIPYTSIIEQNAKIFKDALGTYNVLEHHSNFQYESLHKEPADVEEKIRLSAENWDIPVVVTTNVQFFESLFSNRGSKCRKLHNIAKSVIIFDEAQMLPIDFLRPCVQSMAELVTNYRCTVVLCTATQPALNDFFPKTLIPIEIMKSPNELYNCFKRVNVILKGDIDDNELSDELIGYDQALCIVNTRKHAQVLFNKLKKYGSAFHLSTYMCPVHRLETIKEIKYCLDNNLQCRVVATPLIEAGVDLDFPVVYRAVAGLDSIIQAAGRCNRNGKLEAGKVFVFYSKEKHGMPLKGRNSRKVQIMELIFRRFEDPISLDAIKEYFEQLYDIEGDDRLDKEGIINMFEEGSGYLDFKFEEAAEKFKLIKNNTIPIIIPYDTLAESLVDEARNSMFPATLMRKLQPYTITVFENEYRELLSMGVIDNIKGIFDVLIDKKLYNTDTGLSTTGIESYGDALFI